MLAKAGRLVKEKDFQRVFAQGKSFFVNELGIKAAKNDLAISRFGISVGLKVSKKAVIRNQVKRRLSEIFRLNLDKIKPGYDLVVVTLPGVEAKEYQELQEMVLKAIKKLNLDKIM